MNFQVFLRCILYILSAIVMLSVCGQYAHVHSMECSPTVQSRIVRGIEPFVYGLKCGPRVDDTFGWLGLIWRKLFLIFEPASGMDEMDGCVLDWQMVSLRFSVVGCRYDATPVSWLPNGTTLTVCATWMVLLDLYFLLKYFAKGFKENTVDEVELGITNANLNEEKKNLKSIDNVTPKALSVKGQKVLSRKNSSGCSGNVPQDKTPESVKDADKGKAGSAGISTEKQQISSKDENSNIASASFESREREFVTEIAGYTILGKLASGSFGTTYIARRKDRGNEYVAMKFTVKDILKVCRRNGLMKSMARIEAQIMGSSLFCPFLITMKTCFQTYDYIVYVMPLMCGTLVEYEGIFTSRQLVLVAAEMVSGLTHLHNMGYIHRDLKLDNILVDTRGHIKISDFGLAQQRVFRVKKKYGVVGTPKYAAPEVFHSLPYNEVSDYWGLGIILYVLCEDIMPPIDGQRCTSMKMIRELPFKEASTEEQIFIRGLLHINPDQRLGSPENLQGDIRTHDFFTGIDFDKLWDGHYEGPCPGMPDLSDEFEKQDSEEEWDYVQDYVKDRFEGIGVTAMDGVAPEDLRTYPEFQVKAV